MNTDVMFTDSILTVILEQLLHDMCKYAHPTNVSSTSPECRGGGVRVSQKTNCGGQASHDRKRPLSVLAAMRCERLV